MLVCLRKPRFVVCHPGFLAGDTSRGMGGVCVEYMVELANRLGADPWFSMPKARVTGNLSRGSGDVVQRPHVVEGTLKLNRKCYLPVI